MTAQFPSNIYSERETENLPGIVFDSAKKQNLYSEDFQNHAAEIIAIEQTLGENPQGDYDTVRAWLDALEAGGGGGGISNLDGGSPSTFYSALDPIDGGNP